MSKIGLIDVDGHNFPNLALMKLSSWHKREGDSVEWYSGIEHYDRVYMSKVFAFTPDDLRVIQADEVVKGGLCSFRNALQRFRHKSTTHQ